MQARLVQQNKDVMLNVIASYEIELWPPGAPKLGAELIFMSSFGRLPDWDSIVIRSPPISPSKCRKPVKIRKIRYNKKPLYLKNQKIDFKSTGSVPVSLQPSGAITHAYFQLYMLSTTCNQYFTS